MSPPLAGGTASTDNGTTSPPAATSDSRTTSPPTTVTSDDGSGGGTPTKMREKDDTLGVACNWVSCVRHIGCDVCLFVRYSCLLLTVVLIQL